MACGNSGAWGNMTEIRTKRLLLRPMKTTDRDDLFAVFCDPRVMRYWSTLPHTTPDQTAAFIRETMNADAKKTADFAVELNGRVIGKAGFWNLPEIGYLLHRDFWQQGYGSEALRALLQYGFQQQGLDRVTADVDPDNQASIALLQKLGFAETGRDKNTMEIGGTWFDSIYFALERATWAQNQRQ